MAALTRAPVAPIARQSALAGSRPSFASRQSVRIAQRSTCIVRAEQNVTETATVPEPKPIQDSYSRIEAPVRGGEQAPGKIPDGGPPVSERLNNIDRILINNDGADERAILGNEVSFPDAFRFKGAAPEIINCRLAMWGFAAAVGAEFATGQRVSQQFAQAPFPILATFLLITAASLVPISKGVPRKGGKDWPFGLAAFTPDAELIMGRTAMLGFVSLLITEAVKGAAVF